MTWRQLLDWTNDPARTNTELRDAIVALEGSGISIPKGGSYKTRLTSAIATQPDLTATAPWNPAGYIPPTPVPAPAPAQPVQPAIPAATVVQPAQPAQPQATVATTTPGRRTNMRVLLAGVVLALAAVWLVTALVNQDPWPFNDETDNGPMLVATATAAPTASPQVTAAPTSQATATPAPQVTATASPAATPSATDLLLMQVLEQLKNQPSAPSATATVSPTTAPAPPSTPVVDVPQPAANCWTTAEAKTLTGVDVQRIGTELCAWVWRAVGVGATTAQCPEGALCTFDTGNGIVVDMGAGSRSIVAATWRKVDSYPETDAVHRPCELLAKEQQFGRQEDPSFTVQAGNGLDCPGATSAPQTSNSSTSSCPSSAEEVADLVGGDAGSWNQIESNGWKYIGNEATLTVPPTGLLDHPAGRSTPGQSVSASEATLWCPA